MRRVAIVFVIGGMASCEAGDSIGNEHASEAVFGTFSFSPSQMQGICSPNDRQAITESLFWGALAASSHAFEACLSSRISADYVPCSRDPANFATLPVSERIRLALLAARDPNPTFHECDGAPPGSSASTTPGLAYGTHITELVIWNRTWLTATVDGDLADRRPFCTQLGQFGCRFRTRFAPNMSPVIWHEASHQQGFEHSCPTQPYQTIPREIETCMSDVLQRSTILCDPAVSCGAGNKGRLLIKDLNSTACECVVKGCWDFTDVDGDGVGDACDRCPGEVDAVDVDNDGICGIDNCPTKPNPDQKNSDGDAFGDACDPCPIDPVLDADTDGLCSSDKCPTTYSPLNGDVDLDGLGDNCDPDIDGDGALNKSDNCPYAGNANQADSDANGVGDICDCGFNDNPNMGFPFPSVMCQHFRNGTVYSILDSRLQVYAEFLSTQHRAGPWPPWKQFFGRTGTTHPLEDPSIAQAHVSAWFGEHPGTKVLSQADVRAIFLRDTLLTSTQLDAFLSWRIPLRNEYTIWW